MRKHDIARELSARTGMTQREAYRAIDELHDIVKGALGRGESVMVRDFFSFEIRERAGKRWKNPAVNRVYDLPAGKHVFVRAGKSLQDIVKDGKSGE